MGVFDAVAVGGDTNLGVETAMNVAQFDESFGLSAYEWCYVAKLLIAAAREPRVCWCGAVVYTPLETQLGVLPAGSADAFAARRSCTVQCGRGAGAAGPSTRGPHTVREFCGDGMRDEVCARTDVSVVNVGDAVVFAEGCSNVTERTAEPGLRKADTECTAPSAWCGLRQTPLELCNSFHPLSGEEEEDEAVDECECVSDGEAFDA